MLSKVLFCFNINFDEFLDKERKKKMKELILEQTEHVQLFFVFPSVDNVVSIIFLDTNS